MNFVFSMFFFAVWPGGRRCANCRDAHFFWEVLWWKHLHMKNMQNNNGKNKKKKFRPMGKVWGEAWQGTWVWTFCFFWFFHVFFAVWPRPRENKKKIRPMGKVWAIHTQTKKTKKTKTQKNKKPKNKKTKKKIAHPKGRGSDAECWVLFFFFGLCVDSHCRCAKQRSGTVSGCTRSKVDTLQYSNVCYDIVHSANEQQRGMEFNFVRLRHMLLDLCTGNAAICALPWWPVLLINLQQWWCFMGYWDVTDDATWCNHQNPIESH